MTVYERDAQLLLHDVSVSQQEHAQTYGNLVTKTPLYDFEATHVGAIQTRQQARKTTTIQTTGQWACDHCSRESRIGFYAQHQ